LGDRDPKQQSAPVVRCRPEGQQRDQELWKAVEMVVGWFVNFATHTLDHASAHDDAVNLCEPSVMVACQAPAPLILSQLTLHQQGAAAYAGPSVSWVSLVLVCLA